MATAIDAYQRLQDLLRETEGPAAEAPAPGSVEEAEALQRFAALWSDMDPQSVAERARKTYAEDSYLYDTVKLLRGRGAIADYLQATAQRAAGVQVRIEETVRNGPSFYLRWVMEIEWKAFGKGRRTRSVGVSLLRFNANGEVLLHHDFWDLADGIYEHLPLLGTVLRWIKGRM